MKKKTAAWRNRIVGHEDVDPASIKISGLNWRNHNEFQRRAMRGILGEVGWIQSAIVSKRTGFCLDGHMRIEEAIRNKEPSIPVTYVDLSEAEEKTVLAAVDPIGDLADPDVGRLDALLADVTVFDADLQAMFGMLHSDVEGASLKDSGDTDANVNSATRFDNKPGSTVKAIIATEMVGLFERAVQATGKRNRAEALAVICRSFLGEEED